MSGEPIVVGTDGSATAERAVDKAGELARALGAAVHVVMSFPNLTTNASLAVAGGMTLDPVAENDGVRSNAETVVERAGQRLERSGLVVSRHVRIGDPADALIAVADDVGAQMIVVGNRGMTGARRVLGSVPNRVSHHAPCCVLLVKTQ